MTVRSAINSPSTGDTLSTLEATWVAGMTGFLAYAYLASAVVIPLILRSSGFGLESLFQMSRWPCGRVLQVLAVFVFALQVFAAIMWLSLRTRLFGEPILLWSGLALLFYLWVRALNVIRSRNKPA